MRFRSCWFGMAKIFSKRAVAQCFYWSRDLHFVPKSLSWGHLALVHELSGMVTRCYEPIVAYLPFWGSISYQGFDPWKSSASTGNSVLL